ncbi:hypothetical protein BV20DRAFT_84730 [Pilatotrama ljubarskyi]|nr:hypothetical protein BV20DRAFT_84730 [Pilatotrama ljubarskyi]
MIAGPAFVISLMGSALALSTHYPRGGILSARQNPSDQDLLNACPGGSGSSLERADRCTLVHIVNNPDVRKFVALGSPELNCDGGSDPITVTLGGSSTVSETTTLNADLGVDIEGIKIGGGASDSKTTSSTISKTVSFQVNPGRQAVYVAGTNFKSQTGNIQVNFGDRVDGHFIWFTGTTITQLTPDPSDVQFEVHETACGTDPTDLSSLNS